MIIEMENEKSFIKEYTSVDDINLKDDSIIISPSGKIFKFDPDNLREEFISYLNNNNVNYNSVIDMISEELYTRGYDLEEVNLDDINKVIKDIFGYIIYDSENHRFSYAKGYIYKKFTPIQNNILLKLNERLSNEKFWEVEECKSKKFQ